MKITVLGAAGGIGQPLSMLLKMKLPAGCQLALYDLAPGTPGVGVDLDHIPTAIPVVGYTDPDLPKALTGSDIVLIAAGLARKPGMDRSDLFKFNAQVVQTLVSAIAKHCPLACIAIITNPVNSLVPVAAETLRQAGVYDAHKLLGITTLDVLRAETFLAQALNRPVGSFRVDVIGGHNGKTILPVLSTLCGDELSALKIQQLTTRIQEAGTEVVNAKAGAGSATLSMAAAAYRFVLALIRGMSGEDGVIECAYVEGGNPVCRFFAQPVLLGPSGWQSLVPYGPLSASEQQAVDLMLPTLQSEIEQGERFVQASTDGATHRVA